MWGAVFNLKRYLSILRLFLKAKLVFKNPQKHEMVIFDDQCIIDLENLIHHYNFFVLQTRIENINKIYFSFKILKYFFIFPSPFLPRFELDIKSLKSSTKFSLKKLIVSFIPVSKKTLQKPNFLTCAV